jgi:EmrB/QacA subfamily drug resistance transporter
VVSPLSTVARPPAGTEPSEALRWGTVLVLLGGVFMVVLDAFIVNVAIPELQHDLRASPAAVEWVVAGYALAYGSGLIVAGRLGDILGRRRMFGLGMALFTLASLACGLAPSAGALVATRVAQGLAAALLSPQVLSTLSTQFTGTARLRALNAYGVTMGVAAVLGQLVGGLLIQFDAFGLGWRTCFLINVPVGLVTLVLLPRLVGESRAPVRPRLDLVGTGLVAATGVAIVLPLIDGRAHGWPRWAWLCLAGAVPLFGLLVAHQRGLAARGGTPLLAPALFRERVFTAGLVVQSTFWAGQASFFLVLALYLQVGRGLSALQAGEVFVAVGVGYLVTSTTARHVAARLGRQVIALGALLRVAGLGLLLVTVHGVGLTGSLWWLVPALAIDGAGMGFAIAPLATIVLSRVTPQHAGAAAGVLSTGAQVTGAVGVAAIGVIFFGTLDHHGYVPAFLASLTFLLVICAAVAALTQLLPGHDPRGH